MSHTGKVHEGDEQSGNTVRRILVVTEGYVEPQAGASIKYIVSQRPRRKDFLNYTGDVSKVPTGTPVTFTNQAGIFTNVTPLKTSHFLYNVIKNNKTREKIRYEAWQEINKQFEGDKEVELGDSGKVRRIERPIFGDPAFDTEGFEETDTDHHIRNE